MTADQYVSMEDFQKIDLRVGRVLAAEGLKGSDRLLCVRVDIGGEERQLIAGVAEHYAVQDLVGKFIVVVANLKPAKIFGQISEGMLLAAVQDGDLRLLTIDGPIATGAKVS